MSKNIVILLVLAFLVVSLAAATEQAEAQYSGTVTIKADGSIDPATAPISTNDNVTYTLTDDIHFNISPDQIRRIEVERFNTVLDGARAREILGLKWKDVSGNFITINKPVKGHLPGQCEISKELAAMLDNLPKTSERIFPTTYASLGQCMRKLRQATARKMQNPRILNVTLKSFRHFGGSWLAQITGGNELAVKKALRHKRVENTMKYIHRLEFKDPQNYDVANATTVEDITQLAKQGYTKFDEVNGIHVYRRPKYNS